MHRKPQLAHPLRAPSRSRNAASEIYQKTTNNYLDGETGNDAHGGRRDAVKGNQGGITNVSEYKKKCVEKDQITRDLLLSVVSSNVLLAQCFEEEIQDIIDSFESVKIESGTKVINQGDQADLFYVIESGSFDVYVKAKGQKHSSLIEGATIQEVREKPIVNPTSCTAFLLT